LRTPVAYHHKKTGHSNAGSSSKKPDKKNVVKNFVKAFRVYLKKLKEDKKSEDNFPV
jgi:hypothetical protein